MVRKFWIEFDNWEPVLNFYKRDKRGNTWHTRHHLLYMFRRLKWKRECKEIYKYLKSTGVEPIKCVGCGEGWAEYTIENPNFEEYDIWKVCRGCVSFYDRKWTNKKLYKEVEEDFRG